MFPLVWRSYDCDQPADKNRMLGAHGIARDRLAPSGYILVHGEPWEAEVLEGGAPIESGEGVLVRGMHGLTLMVQPDNEEPK